MSFNPSQTKAIKHNKGPMLVLAGPGSGKTLVITQRTRYLIEEHGVNPSNILVITFTKAAANEMKQRFCSLMGEERIPVHFGTFHAVFFTILRYAYGFTGNNILREDQKVQLLKEIILPMEIEIQDEKEFVSGIIGEISLVKGSRIDVNHYYAMNCSEEAFKHIYCSYEQTLRNRNQIDFDDMLSMCYELLTQRADILKIWQEKYRYILVDEFQDVNQVQYDIVRLLARPEDNLFIVGDDDQSIYRFRGAKPEIMLNFEKDYPGTEKLLLDINYRSCGHIIEAAGRVIKHNKARFEKQIIPKHPPGNPVKIQNFLTLSQENRQVVEQILKAKQEGHPFSETAVLFRTNTQPRALLERFLEYNIPFRMKDHIPNLYDHWIVKNILTYIEIAKGSHDRSLFLQIANRPNRYLSRACFSDTEVRFSDLRKYYSDKEWMLDRIHKLEYDLGMLKNMAPYAAIQYIRKGIEYDKYLKDYAESKRIQPEEFLEILDELMENSREYKTYESWFKHMEDYRDELQKQEEAGNQKDVDSVTMSTMHSAKGLEYETVYIIDANEGIMPHHKAIVDEDMEEERRMFYVAMTRAKTNLFIYTVKERYNKEFTPSRFVGEYYLDQDLLVRGVQIRHKTYGKGKVLECSQGKLKVKFEASMRPRLLNLDFCIQNLLLEIVE